MFDVKVKIGDKERINKFGYLPDDFNRPPWLLPNGVKCMGRTAVETRNGRKP